MPPRKFEKSKKLKQTTLFDTTIASSLGQPSTKSHSSPPSASTVKPKRKRAPISSSSDESDIGAIHFAPTPDKKISSDDDGIVPTASKLHRRRNLRRFVSKSSSEEENMTSKVCASVLVDSELEDQSPRKRLRRRRSKGGDTLDEEVIHLTEEVDEEYILDERLRTRNKKSIYQQNLEKLKGRKLKTNYAEDSDENDPEIMIASDEDEDEESFKPFKGSKLSNLGDNAEGDESGDTGDSSDFIVEDDTVFQLPAQFSMEAHQDLSHQFKKVFQFLVHVAVQPSRRRESFMEEKLAHEEYFSVPLQVMRRKLLGIRDSLVSSSVWKPQFRKKLEKYPEFSLLPLDFAVPYCDACHLGGRMSTLIGRLTGSQYNALGFGFLKSDDGMDNADKKHEYHLGRFCARRTRVYHEFTHWEHALFQCISKEIDELRGSQSGRGFHRVAYFKGKEPPDDLSDADALCDWLDQRRIIDMEWQKLKAMMESAHHLEIHKGGEVED